MARLCYMLKSIIKITYDYALNLCSSCCSELRNTSSWALLQIVAFITVVYCLGLSSNIVLDLAIIMGSNGKENSFSTQKEFAKSYLQKLDIGPKKTLVGIVLNAEIPLISTQLDSEQSINKDEILKAVSKLKNIGGGSNLGDALKLVRTELFSSEKGSRIGSSKMILVIVDSRTTGSFAVLDREVAKLKESGVKIVVVAFGNDVNIPELDNVASTDGDLIKGKEMDDLKELVDIILGKTIPGNFLQSQYYQC